MACKCKEMGCVDDIHWTSDNPGGQDDGAIIAFLAIGIVGFLMGTGVGMVLMALGR